VLEIVRPMIEEGKALAVGQPRTQRPGLSHRGSGFSRCASSSTESEERETAQSNARSVGPTRPPVTPRVVSDPPDMARS
jgi:hypothetical protein